jgi:hypothetical protein
MLIYLLSVSIVGQKQSRFIAEYLEDCVDDLLGVI